MTPKKRSMDEVFAAIEAAMAETGGRTLQKIDPAHDSAVAAARRQVRVTLHDYQPYPGAEPGDAEWRYRLELERALGGPLAVPDALRAWSLCSESENACVGAEDRVLAAAWVAATRRAKLEGTRNLAESHTAWFEVRAVRTAPATPVPARVVPPCAPPMARPGPRQSELF